MRFPLLAFVDCRFGKINSPESDHLNYWNDNRKLKSLQRGREGKVEGGAGKCTQTTCEI